MYKKDYYKILGLKRESAEEEIKRNRRQPVFKGKVRGTLIKGGEYDEIISSLFKSDR